MYISIYVYITYIYVIIYIYTYVCVYICVCTHTTTTTKNTLRNKHQWMSAKVPSLEADLFFIKINCVAGAAYLSMPPADTSVPLLQQQCECVVCFNAIKQWKCYQTLPKAYERVRGEFRPKISMFPRDPKVYTLNRDMRKEFCYDLFSQMKYCFLYLYYI